MDEKEKKQKEINEQLVKKQEELQSMLKKHDELLEVVVKSKEVLESLKKGDSNNALKAAEDNVKKIEALEKEVKEVKEIQRLTDAPLSIEEKSDKKLQELLQKAASFQEGGRMSLGKIEVKDLLTPTLVTRPARRLSRIVDDTSGQQWTLRDFVNVIPTTSNLIEWVEIVNSTNNAAVRPESSAAALSNFEQVLRSESSKSISHYFAVSRESLKNVAGLQAQIRTKLVEGIAEAEEKQMILGDGTGNNFTGLVTKLNALSLKYEAAQFTAAGVDNRLDKIHHMIYAVGRTCHKNVDAVVVSDETWEILERVKDTQGLYKLMVSPHGTSQKRLFGRPIITNYTLSKDQILVGNFANGVELHQDQAITITLSDQHADFFIKKMVAVMGEQRSLLAFLQPNCMAVGTIA